MIQSYLGALPDAILLIGTGALWMLLFWHVIDWITPFDDEAELRHNDIAYALERGGLALAQVIGLVAATTLFSPDDRWATFGYVNLASLWATLALVLARPLLNKAMLPMLNEEREVLHGNLAIALLNAGAYLGVGCIGGASLVGSGGSRWVTALATVVFYLLGLLFVALVFWLHRWVTPYDLSGRLREGRLSAGIECGALLLAASIVTAVGVAGDLTTWADGVLAFVLTAGISLVLLLPLWYALVLAGPGHSPRHTHERETPAAAIVVAALLLGAAVLIAAVIARS